MQLTEDYCQKQILVVGGERLLAADLQNRLKRLGYSVPAIAHSADEALQCARSMRFDLVLMDIHLKGMTDGIEAAHTLRAKFDVPVVHLIAHADLKTLGPAKLVRPGGYIIKPITDADLHRAVPMSIHNNEVERRIRSSETGLSSTLCSVGDGVIATNLSGEIVFMNPVAEQLTGWSGADAFGRLLMDVLGLFETSDSQPAKHPAFDLAAGERRTYTLTSKAGVKTLVDVGWFENRSTEELMGAVFAVRGVSAKMEMERQSNAVANDGSYHQHGRGLAHDFNNQLAVILGSARELYKRLSGKNKEDALEVKQSALNASAITSQLVTVSRLDASKSKC